MHRLWTVAIYIFTELIKRKFYGSIDCRLQPSNIPNVVAVCICIQINVCCCLVVCSPNMRQRRAYIKCHFIKFSESEKLSHFRAEKRYSHKYINTDTHTQAHTHTHKPVYRINTFRFHCFHPDWNAAAFIK